MDALDIDALKTLQEIMEDEFDDNADYIWAQADNFWKVFCK